MPRGGKLEGRKSRIYGNPPEADLRPRQSLNSEVIPFYDLCIEIMISVVKTADCSFNRILELGVAIGKLARRLLSEFDNARIEGIDFVAVLLEIAAHKLKKFGPRSSLICNDRRYAKCCFPAGSRSSARATGCTRPEDSFGGRSVVSCHGNHRLPH